MTKLEQICLDIAEIRGWPITEKSWADFKPTYNCSLTNDSIVLNYTEIVGGECLEEVKNRTKYINKKYLELNKDEYCNLELELIREELIERGRQDERYKITEKVYQGVNCLMWSTSIPGFGSCYVVQKLEYLAELPNYIPEILSINLVKVYPKTNYIINRYYKEIKYKTGKVEYVQYNL